MLTDTARICRHVADRGEAILRACRHDGAPEGVPEWSFGCGRAEDATAGERLWALDQVLALDPSAIEIVLHPRGTGHLGEPGGEQVAVAGLVIGQAQAARQAAG